MEFIYKKFNNLVKSDVYDYLEFNVNDEIKKEFIFYFHSSILTLDIILKKSINYIKICKEIMINHSFLI